MAKTGGYLANVRCFPRLAGIDMPQSTARCNDVAVISRPHRFVLLCMRFGQQAMDELNASSHQTIRCYSTLQPAKCN